MAQPDDLEARVTALETQFREVHAGRQDAAAARILAGGADRDVNEVRGDIRDFRQATTAGFNAMREDHIDLRRQMEAGFADMRGRLDAAAAGHQQIADLLTTLVSRQDGGE